MNDDLKEKIGKTIIALTALTDSLKELAGAEKPKAAETPARETPADQPSLEEVRTVLADISRSGKTTEMKALLSEFGAAKLSDVDPSRYAELLARAKEVNNA